MSGLDQFAISRILGSTVQPYSQQAFGGFSAVKSVGEMLASRPKGHGLLKPERSRDDRIIAGFRSTHRGYSVDRVLADPELAAQFVREVHRSGVDAPAALVYRRLLRIRKSGQLRVDTTVEEKRDLDSFLIPAELAFAQLTYRYEASYDDLLADPDIGAAFDALAMKIGHGGSVVDYRLAALHLRKNIRSRRGDETIRLSGIGLADLTKRWRPVGAFARVPLGEISDGEGIFALSEPNRYLYLTRYSNLREGVDRFRDPALLSGLSNRFWTPALESISLQLISGNEANGATLRLLELKALEVYRPIFNLLPAPHSHALRQRRAG